MNEWMNVLEIEKVLKLKDCEEHFALLSYSVLDEYLLSKLLANYLDVSFSDESIDLWNELH